MKSTCLFFLGNLWVFSASSCHSWPSDEVIAVEIESRNLRVNAPILHIPQVVELKFCSEVSLTPGWGVAASLLLVSNIAWMLLSDHFPQQWCSFLSSPRKYPPFSYRCALATSHWNTNLSPDIHLGHGDQGLRHSETRFPKITTCLHLGLVVESTFPKHQDRWARNEDGWKPSRMSAQGRSLYFKFGCHSFLGGKGEKRLGMNRDDN